MPLSHYQNLQGVYSKDSHFSESCLEHYLQEGWVLLKDFYNFEEDLLPIHKNVNQLIKLKSEELNLPFDIDVDDRINNEVFLKICEKDRAKAGEIYRATRHLAATHKLLQKEENIRLAQFLMSTNNVNVIPYVPLRIDIKGEEKYLFDWHQDFPYTQGSTDGIVSWAPLFDVINGEGGIKLIPRSHHCGILPVKVADKKNANANGAHTIRLVELDSLEDEEAFTIDVNAGDVLVFSTLLLHKSIPLPTQKIRWTTQLRYANFDQKEAVMKGWPGGMIEGNWFEDIYPEYVVNN
ncbi:phytanoyl-CoA dioxygenase family protein [Alteromonas gracilis]|uniref:phytanoyl-CoA dioxygenase family protein n=1 Tax=Alteromonas gracilis TaxID=1479524 RepID=UPI0030CD8ACD